MTEQLDFHERLQFSQGKEITETLDRFYLKAFSAERIKRLDEGRFLDIQREGVDLLVFGPHGAQTVEEKIREKAYDPPDVFLETVSVDKTGAPGWAVKPFQARWLSYYRPQGDVVLFPGWGLRPVVRSNIEAWKVEYGEKRVFNNGYSTYGVPVPDEVLWREIDDMLGATHCFSCGMPVNWSDLKFSLLRGISCLHCTETT